MNKKLDASDKATKIADSASTEESRQKAIEQIAGILGSYDPRWILDLPINPLQNPRYHALYCAPQIPMAAALTEKLSSLKLPEMLTFLDTEGRNITVFYSANVSVPEESAEENKQIDELLAQIENKRRKMQEDQKEIEKLGHETREIISKLISR
jgi:hypothetical protein